jgi:hypothetical protein
MKEAVERRKTLSEYLIYLIEVGWERIKEERVIQENENDREERMK